MTFDSFLIAIEKNNSFIITTHINPDGDGVGAALAMCKMLMSLGKKTQLLIRDTLSSNLLYMEEYFEIKREFSKELLGYDAVLVLDSSNVERTGFENTELFNRFKINIDHHSDNNKFGDVNIVNSNASSTCEIIYDVMVAMGVLPDADTAEFLYTGILIDTGGFKFSNTTAKTFNICEKLIDSGIDASKIYRKVFFNFPIARQKVLGYLMYNAEYVLDGKVCLFLLKESDLKDMDANKDVLEGLSNFTLASTGVVAGAFLYEKENKETKVAIRSDGSVDVQSVAKVFDGGGHKAASGFTLNCNIEEASKRVSSELANVL